MTRGDNGVLKHSKPSFSMASAIFDSAYLKNYSNLNSPKIPANDKENKCKSLNLY